MRKGKGEERNIKAARSRQVSKFPCPRQHAQQHLKPAQAGLKDEAQDARQQYGRRTQRLLIPGECDLGDRIALRYPAPEKLAGQIALQRFAVPVLYQYSQPVTGRASAREGTASVERESMG